MHGNAYKGNRCSCRGIRMALRNFTVSISIHVGDILLYIPFKICSQLLKNTGL
jgi:hypothetical protein